MRLHLYRKELRNCLKITCAISEGCFFECKEKIAGDAGIAEAF